MAASRGAITTTASRCAPDTARGRHVFEIAGYSLHRGHGDGHSIESATFTFGGHDWCVVCFPDGDDGFYGECVSVFLQHSCERDTCEVRALYDFRLLNPATGLFSPVNTASGTGVFDESCITWGAGDFMKRSELEASYLLDDCLVIECEVTVIKETAVSKPKTVYEIQVPPSDMLGSLGMLLESEEGADLTIKVEGEVFRVHKIVLAMRSPVFKAELYGPMSDKRMETITIDDMQPAVFKALLHFIYRDSLPPMDDLCKDESVEMVKHLLVAADRYAVDRMKVMCESILAKRLDVHSVAATLALADQHHCILLKDACIEFINSSNRMGDVVTSQGYDHLKRACPAVIVEIWERSAKSRKIYDASSVCVNGRPVI
ncbi:hypothetical protein ACP70R_003276 [Stipagrostis hirtigluma subsp. patula]